MNWIAERNSLSLKSLRLRENYAINMKQLEKILDDYRFNLSKTKYFFLAPEITSKC